MRDDNETRKKSNNQEPRIVEKRSVIDVNPQMSNSRIIHKRHKPWLRAIVIFIITFSLIIGAIIVYGYFFYKKPVTAPQQQDKPLPQPSVSTGKILKTDQPINYDANQTLALIKETSHSFDTPVTVGIQKQVIRYTSSDGTNSDVPIYAKVYTPQNITGKKLPVLAFAPGTTGMGDDCAASLEVAARRNWANYDSLLAAYASQGYIVVMTDYEGMRDPSRIHHYMVGELEGRAVIDSVRALKNLKSTKDNINDSAIFTGGYSQGGHASYWADQIAPTYSPEIKLAGSIGFGPVTDVSQTLTDAITSNANINWFGPYVITSYQDWYKHVYPVDKILLPQWNLRLRTDVLTQCVDMVDKFWPNNNGLSRSAQVYTPQFIAAANSGSIANDPEYKQFAADMFKNITGTTKTSTPLLINQGLYDNVILPKQSQAARARFCKTGNAVTYREYDRSPYAIQVYNPAGLVDHYQTMDASYKDTMAWMNTIISGGSPPNNCI